MTKCLQNESLLISKYLNLQFKIPGKKNFSFFKFGILLIQLSENINGERERKVREYVKERREKIVKRMLAKLNKPALECVFLAKHAT